MQALLENAMSNPAAVSEAQTLARTYWSSFERNPQAGRAYTEGGPKVIMPAAVMAIHLPHALSDQIGDAGANLVMYGIGKSIGAFSAEHFREWCVRHGIGGEVLSHGAMFWPMHVGLSPRLEVVQNVPGHPGAVLVEVTTSILSELRQKHGLDTTPAHWLVSGFLAGAVGKGTGRAMEGREVPGSGETTYRIVLTDANKLGSLDLADPVWKAPLAPMSPLVITG